VRVDGKLMHFNKTIKTRIKENIASIDLFLIGAKKGEL